MKGSIKKYVSPKTGKVSWVATYDLPPDPVTNKRRQKRVTASTKKEAEAILAKALHELQSGTYIEPTKTSLGEYLMKWLDAVEPTIRPSTYSVYRTIIRHHLVRQLGATPLAKLAVNGQVL